MEKMLEKAKEVKGLKKTISKQAKETGLKFNLKGEKEMLFKVFQKIYFGKVKELLGFGECKSFFSGAAPIDEKVKFGSKYLMKKRHFQTMNYFLSLDIHILQLYGMSESTGMHTSEV